MGFAQVHLSKIGMAGLLSMDSLDEETRRALTHFQRSCGLRVTGILDPHTWELLLSLVDDEGLTGSGITQDLQLEVTPVGPGEVLRPVQFLVQFAQGDELPTSDRRESDGTGEYIPRGIDDHE